MNLKILLVLVLPIMLMGCDIANKHNPAMVPEHVVEAQGAESINALVRIRSGEIKVGGNALAALVAQYRYKTPIRIPQVNYEVVEKVGMLLLSQELVPTIGSFARDNALNFWDVQFNKNIPLDLNLEFGKGKGELDLNMLKLRRLKVTNDKGQLDIDLASFNQDEDLVLWIDNQSGDFNIALPKNVGIHISTVRGGAIEAQGFNKKDAIYTNDLQGKTKTHIYLDIKNIAGNVTIQ